MQRQVAAHDADGMQEGQLIRVAIHGGAGLYHQAAQREVGQQQTEHLLLGKVGQHGVTLISAKIVSASQRS